MGSNAIGFIIFLIVFALVAGRFLLKVLKMGGFKAAMFGAPIERTIGEVSCTTSRLMSMTLRVHALAGGDTDRKVGLELVTKSFASYQMMPASLSATEAKELIQLLQSATRTS